MRFAIPRLEVRIDRFGRIGCATGMRAPFAVATAPPPPPWTLPECGDESATSLTPRIEVSEAVRDSGDIYRNSLARSDRRAARRHLWQGYPVDRILSKTLNIRLVEPVRSE
jgi:hypothetical protein